MMGKLLQISRLPQRGGLALSGPANGKRKRQMWIPLLHLRRKPFKMRQLI
jgi:hypothetical protein